MPACMKLTVQKGRQNSEMNFCTKKNFTYAKKETNNLTGKVEYLETEFNVDSNLLLYLMINPKYIKIKTVKRKQKLNIYLFSVCGETVCIWKREKSTARKENKFE